MPRARLFAFLVLAITFAASGWWWSRDEGPHYLDSNPAAFVATFTPPPAAQSAQAEAELSEAMVASRSSDAARRAAYEDRRKQVDRFYEALGFAPGHAQRLPALEKLATRVEDDVSVYVRAAKLTFPRPRPFAVDPNISPCVADVDAQRSYPSGHATYGFVIAYLLADMVPERRAELLARAELYAQHRKICGVHFESDLRAGERGAQWLAAKLLADEDYREDAAKAREELRAALSLPN